MSDQALDLNPKETALIMVDMQNDFCHPEGFYARNRDRMTSIGLVPELVEGRVGTMKELLRAAREAGLFIVHTQIVRDDDPSHYMWKIHKVVPRTFQAVSGASETPLVPGSWGAETHDELAPAEGEHVLVKRAFSSFYQTDLELMLRRRGIRTVIIAGTVTYACVLHTAFDANVRDFDVVMPSDGVASWAADLQDPTLRIVDLILGASVSTGELLELLAAGKVSR